jgi:hypothetical protein
MVIPLMSIFVQILNKIKYYKLKIEFCCILKMNEIKNKIKNLILYFDLNFVIFRLFSGFHMIFTYNYIYIETSHRQKKIHIAFTGNRTPDPGDLNPTLWQLATMNRCWSTLNFGY